MIIINPPTRWQWHCLLYRPPGRRAGFLLLCDSTFKTPAKIRKFRVEICNLLTHHFKWTVLQHKIQSVSRLQKWILLGARWREATRWSCRAIRVGPKPWEGKIPSLCTVSPITACFTVHVLVQKPDNSTHALYFFHGCKPTLMVHGSFVALHLTAARPGHGIEKFSGSIYLIAS